MKSLFGLVWFVGLILLQIANAVNTFTNPGFPPRFEFELTVVLLETPSSKPEEVLLISCTANTLGATTYSLRI
jgi:hypothetical protein